MNSSICYGMLLISVSLCSFIILRIMPHFLLSSSSEIMLKNCSSSCSLLKDSRHPAVFFVLFVFFYRIYICLYLCCFPDDIGIWSIVGKKNSHLLLIWAFLNILRCWTLSSAFSMLLYNLHLNSFMITHWQKFFLPKLLLNCWYKTYIRILKIQRWSQII